MKTEAWLRRKIEIKEQLIQITQDDIGDLKRELAIHLGQDVNQQQSYGGDIHQWSTTSDGQTMIITNYPEKN